MEENVIQIKSKITIDVDVIINNIIDAKEPDIWNPGTSISEYVNAWQVFLIIQ